MHRLSSQFLEADPDVRLDVFDQMPDVDRAVGVRQGAGDQDLACHGGDFIVKGDGLGIVIIWTSVDDGMCQAAPRNRSTEGGRSRTSRETAKSEKSNEIRL